MSLEVFEKLEAKVQQAIDTITLLQMEIEELKEKNNSLTQEVQSAQHQREELERENNSLKEQQAAGRNVCRRCLVVWKKSNPRHISRYGGVGCVRSPQSHSGLCSWGFTYLPPCPDAKSIEDLECGYRWAG